jgi:hypothetical protein
MPFAPTSSPRRSIASFLRTGALALLLPAALLAPPAFAADEAKVDELMVILQLDKMNAQMLEMMDGVLEKSFLDTSAQHGLTEAQIAARRPQLQRMKNAMRDVLSWEALAPEYRKIYIELLTDAEVDAAIAYYRSPAGASMMAKMPQLMQRGMEVGQRRAAEVMPRVMAEMQQAVEAESAPAATE